MFCEEQKRKIPMSEKHLAAKVAKQKIDLQENRKESRDLRRQTKSLCVYINFTAHSRLYFQN